MIFDKISNIDDKTANSVTKLGDNKFRHTVKCD